jgi:hypothetical protein
MTSLRHERPVGLHSACASHGAYMAVWLVTSSPRLLAGFRPNFHSSWWSTSLIASTDFPRGRLVRPALAAWTPSRAKWFPATSKPDPATTSTPHLLGDPSEPVPCVQRDGGGLIALPGDGRANPASPRRPGSHLTGLRGAETSGSASLPGSSACEPPPAAA